MIKAIETKWNGYRFRSRLEARWAIFFTALNMKWEYEPEGYETDEGWYLPDFFMGHNQHRGPYVEIKATEPNKSELRKLEEVCLGNGAYGVLIWGAPGKHMWNYADKECGFVRDWLPEQNSHSFLTALNPLFKSGNYQAALDYGVRCARKARFEHGDMPA